MGDSSSNPRGASDLAALGACKGCCNDIASNCGLRLNEATFAMVHNAMSSRDDLFVAYNNLHPLEGALVAGYHGIMLDSCMCNRSIGEDVANAIKGDGDKVREGRGGDDARFN